MEARVSQENPNRGLQEQLNNIGPFWGRECVNAGLQNTIIVRSLWLGCLSGPYQKLLTLESNNPLFAEIEPIIAAARVWGLGQ